MRLWLCITISAVACHYVCVYKRFFTVRLNPAGQLRSFSILALSIALMGGKEGSKWLTSQIYKLFYEYP